MVVWKGFQGLCCQDVSIALPTRYEIVWYKIANEWQVYVEVVLYAKIRMAEGANIRDDLTKQDCSLGKGREYACIRDLLTTLVCQSVSNQDGVSKCGQRA